MTPDKIVANLLPIFGRINPQVVAPIETPARIKQRWARDGIVRGRHVTSHVAA